jgi:hypothetical protein
MTATTYTLSAYQLHLGLYGCECILGDRSRRPRVARVGRDEGPDRVARARVGLQAWVLAAASHHLGAQVRRVRSRPAARGQLADGTPPALFGPAQEAPPAGEGRLQTATA